MIETETGAATWDWQLGRYYALAAGRDHWADTLDELADAVPLSAAQAADLLAYRDLFAGAAA